MSRLSPKTAMFIFGFASIAAVAVFLMLYQGSPGPLSSSHAVVIGGSTIFSCKKCHANEGLAAGCLHCHVEVSGQLDADAGYHAHILKGQPVTCEQCHSEHFGAEFPLVSAVSWQDTDTNSFEHPHVEFSLTGKHDKLACEECHVKKLTEPFALPDFSEHHRTVTMLGLNQECIACHEDIHKSGDKTRDCTTCHNQEAFKPAPFFDHNKYFVLEGPHAIAACASCHKPDIPPLQLEGQPPLTFDPVKGKTCADCHESPHRFEQQLQGDCLSCHKAADEKWSMGKRGIDVIYHEQFDFKLEGAHTRVECAKCHAAELKTYENRFPDPADAGYTRNADQCAGCHKDPHNDQFAGRYASCAQCHTVERFMPSILGPMEHPDAYPLIGSHQAVACVQCHKVDAVSEVRQFKGTPTACRDCHTDPHGKQFEMQIVQNDCTACHPSDFSSFRIQSYTHKNMRAFFVGKGHAQAGCVQCHAGPVNDQGIIQYVATPTECASCHQDIHRGQFLQNGQTQCERCHGTTAKWTADRFAHDRDSTFPLGAAHVKVACASCHLPAPQNDGAAVIQYSPVTTRCEDCHGFQKQ